MKNVLLSADSIESHNSELALLDKFKKFFALFSVCFIFLLATNDIKTQTVTNPCTEGATVLAQFCDWIIYENLMEHFWPNDCEPLNPPNKCSIRVEYCRTQLDRGNGPEWETQIKKVELINCEQDCFDYIWSAALIVASLELDLPTPSCDENFIYTLATCWKPKHEITPWGPGILLGYESCDEGECCAGYYRICKYYEDGEPHMSIEFQSRLVRISHYCSHPCQFTDCLSSVPSLVEPFKLIDFGRIAPGIPKQSQFLDNSLISKLKISPNPANNILNFSCVFENKGAYAIKIFNYYGNSEITLLLDNVYGSYQGKINTSGLSNGIYMMTIEKDNYIIAIENFVIAN